MLSANNITTLFYNRFKKYLSFLEITNHQDLLLSILTFLDLNQLLEFLSTSSYFHTFKNIQSVEVRILRRKLMFYQKDKQQIKMDPFTLYHKINMASDFPYAKPQQMAKRYQSLMMKIPSNYKKLKSDLVKKEQALFLKPQQPNKIINQHNLNAQSFSVHNKQQVKTGNFQINDLKTQLNKNRQNEIDFYKKYQNLVKNNQNPYENDNKNVVRKQNRIVEYNSSVSKLEERQYQEAKLDYMKRKMKSKNLIGYEELKKMAENDPCSRQIFNKLYKGQHQEQNVSKLKMKPAPTIKNNDVQSYKKSQTVEIKNTMAEKVYLGLKSMIRGSKPSE